MVIKIKINCVLNRCISEHNERTLKNAPDQCGVDITLNQLNYTGLQLVPDQLVTETTNQLDYFM